MKPLAALVAVLVLTCAAASAGGSAGSSLAELSPSTADGSAAWAVQQLDVPPLSVPDGLRDGPVVAVIDTGVAPVSDLQGALVPGFDAYGGGETNDQNGHGTAVASLIAGRHDGVGADGVCPTCRIMPIKIAGAEGRASDEAQAAAVNWAVAHGASLINISFVGREPVGAISDAVANAEAHGAVVVAAAGNDGADDRRWPAAYDGVVGVAATDQGGGLAPFSNRGADWVDLAAPGCAPAMDPEQETVVFCGTSAAAPMTAGAAALLKSLAPGLSYATIMDALLRTASPLYGEVRYGRLDVAAAIRQLGLDVSSGSSAAGVGGAAEKKAKHSRVAFD